MVAAVRVAMTVMLGAVVEQVAGLVVEGQVLLVITPKQLVDFLPSKVAIQLTRIHLRRAMMHLVVEVAEATNTEKMDVQPNLVEVLAVVAVIQVEQPLAMVLGVYSAQVAGAVAVVQKLALLVDEAEPGVSTLLAAEVL